MDKIFDEILILYGSQTGTAEDIARHLHRQLNCGLTQSNKQENVSVKVKSCNSFNIIEEWLSSKPQNSQSKLFVFICSTTGQGDPPDNMANFWRVIMSRKFALPLTDVYKTTQPGIRFAVVGLGDSSYERFNFVAKKLFRRLEQLFGTEKSLCPICLVDEQESDAGYHTIDTFTRFLFEILKLGADELNRIDSYPLRFSIFNLASVGASESNDKEEIICGLLDMPDDARLSKIMKNERITAVDHFQDVRFVSLDISDLPLIYFPGDVCCIQPENSSESVNEFIELFADRIKLNSFVQLVDKASSNVTVTVQVSTLIRRYFNFSWTPSRSFFDVLRRLSTSSMEQGRLTELATSYDDLLAYCLRPKRTVLEVFKDFRETTLMLLLEHLLELIPPIRARSFSIASAQIQVGAQIDLLVAVVSYQTQIRKPRRGLCTTWLSRLSPNTSIPIWIRPSSMRLPTIKPAPQPEPYFPPVIMIGPGTGIAPFRAYIQYRRKLAESFLQDSLFEASPQSLWLFFGCRYQTKDFICGPEMTREWPIRLSLAFSRDRDDASKDYVQHRITDQADDLADWILHRDATVCIAGNAHRMPIDVRSAVAAAILGRRGDLISELAVQTYLDEMTRLGRWIVETW